MIAGGDGHFGLILLNGRVAMTWRRVIGASP
jgi:hypothetical protein